MLKQRVLTAAVVIPVIVLGTWFLDTLSFAMLGGLLFILAGWEWAGISGATTHAWRAAYAALLVLLLAAAYLLKDTVFTRVAVNTASAGWVVAAALLVQRQRRQQDFSVPVLMKAALGLLILVPAWLGLVFIHGGNLYGPRLVIFVLVLTWLADAAAFFCGRRWGKRRLADRISPGKTWAGVYGALLASTLAGTGYAWATGLQVPDILVFSFICLVTVMGSIVGDLVESLFKRMNNLKDSGDLFPGHGGAMDRIDSITAAAPIFLTGLWLGGLA